MAPDSVFPPNVGQIAYKPLNFGRWVVWGFTAFLFAVMPAFFSKGFALTLMSQGEFATAKACRSGSTRIDRRHLVPHVRRGPSIC